MTDLYSRIADDDWLKKGMGQEHVQDMKQRRIKESQKAPNVKGVAMNQQEIQDFFGLSKEELKAVDFVEEFVLEA